MNTYVLLWNTYVRKFDRVGRTAKLWFSLSCPPTYLPITVTLRPEVGERESTSSGRWRLCIQRSARKNLRPAVHEDSASSGRRERIYVQRSAFLWSQKLRRARLVSVGRAEAGTDVGTSGRACTTTRTTRASSPSPFCGTRIVTTARASARDPTQRQKNRKETRRWSFEGWIGTTTTTTTTRGCYPGVYTSHACWRDASGRVSRAAGTNPCG